VAKEDRASPRNGSGRGRRSSARLQEGNFGTPRREGRAGLNDVKGKRKTNRGKRVSARVKRLECGVKEVSPEPVRAKKLAKGRS